MMGSDTWSRIFQLFSPRNGPESLSRRGEGSRQRVVGPVAGDLD